jgi:hypothetical protein
MPQRTEDQRRRAREATARFRVRKRAAAAAAGEVLSLANKDKTHCPAGHEYTEENTYWRNGARKCRACANARAKAEYAADPEAGRVKSRANRDKHKDAWNESRQEARAANPETAREQDRERYARDSRKRIGIKLNRQGMTAAEWEAMFRAQHGCCYLCGADLGTNDKHIHLDHDHRCCPPTRSCPKCRRGLACNRCNVIAGWAQDDPDRLRLIADNLELAILLVTKNLEEENCKI